MVEKTEASIPPRCDLLDIPECQQALARDNRTPSTKQEVVSVFTQAGMPGSFNSINSNITNFGQSANGTVSESQTSDSSDVSFVLGPFLMALGKAVKLNPDLAPEVIRRIEEVWEKNDESIHAAGFRMPDLLGRIGPIVPYNDKAVPPGYNVNEIHKGWSRSALPFLNRGSPEQQSARARIETLTDGVVLSGMLEAISCLEECGLVTTGSSSQVSVSNRPYLNAANMGWRDGGFAKDFGGLSTDGHLPLSDDTGAQNQWRSAFQDMANHQISLVRIWIFPELWTDDIIWNGTRATGTNGKINEDICTILSIAADVGIQLQPTIFSFDNFKRRGFDGCSDGRIRDFSPPSNRSLYDIYQNGHLDDLLDNVIGPMIAAAENCPDSAALHSWDAFNEPELVVNENVPLSRFFSQAGNGILTDGQTFDPQDSNCFNNLNATQMRSLISDTLATIRRNSTAETTIGLNVKWNYAFTDLDIDFVSLHTYDHHEPFFPIMNPPSYFNNSGKPTMIGEYPPGGPGHPESLGFEHDDLMQSFYDNGYFGHAPWQYTEDEFGFGGTSLDEQLAFARSNDLTGGNGITVDAAPTEWRQKIRDVIQAHQSYWVEDSTLGPIDPTLSGNVTQITGSGFKDAFDNIIPMNQQAIFLDAMVRYEQLYCDTGFNAKRKCEKWIQTINDNHFYTVNGVDRGFFYNLKPNPGEVPEDYGHTAITVRALKAMAEYGVLGSNALLKRIADSLMRNAFQANGDFAWYNDGNLGHGDTGSVIQRGLINWGAMGSNDGGNRGSGASGNVNFYNAWVWSEMPNSVLDEHRGNINRALDRFTGTGSQNHALARMCLAMEVCRNNTVFYPGEKKGDTSAQDNCFLTVSALGEDDARRCFLQVFALDCGLSVIALGREFELDIALCNCCPVYNGPPLFFSPTDAIQEVRIDSLVDFSQVNDPRLLAVDVKDVSGSVALASTQSFTFNPVNFIDGPQCGYFELEIEYDDCTGEGRLFCIMQVEVVLAHRVVPSVKRKIIVDNGEDALIYLEDDLHPNEATTEPLCQPMFGALSYRPDLNAWAHSHQPGEHGTTTVIVPQYRAGWASRQSRIEATITVRPANVDRAGSADGCRTFLCVRPCGDDAFIPIGYAKSADVSMTPDDIARVNSVIRKAGIELPAGSRTWSVSLSGDLLPDSPQMSAFLTDGLVEISVKRLLSNGRIKTVIQGFLLVSSFSTPKTPNGKDAYTLNGNISGLPTHVTI